MLGQEETFSWDTGRLPHCFLQMPLQGLPGDTAPLSLPVLKGP